VKATTADSYAIFTVHTPGSSGSRSNGFT